MSITHPSLINVLKKINRRGSSVGTKLMELAEQVGNPLSPSDYFLNGTPQPSQYSADQSMAENIVGLKNSISQQKHDLSDHIQKAVKDSDLLWDKFSICNKNLEQLSKSPHAAPKADFEVVKKKIADNLAKNSSLSQGTAFSAMDISARMVEVENGFKRIKTRLDTVSKQVNLLKNNETSSSNEFGVNHNLNEIRERLVKLEEERDAQHSENLFDTSTVDSRINLIQMDLEGLKKDKQLELASSEVNE